jgi:PAS domain S-box-containing protein
MPTSGIEKLSEGTGQDTNRPDTGRAMIVAADDDRESLAMVAAALKSEGMSVRIAESGDQALAQIAAYRPDLVLLGIRLPVLDGFEVCRRMKAGEKTRDIPVVLLSTGEDEAWGEGLKLGAVDFVSKPVQREELIARVKIHVELRRLREDLDRHIAERAAELRSADAMLKVEPPGQVQPDGAHGITAGVLRALAEDAPVGIWVLSAERRLLFHNKRWEGSSDGETSQCGFIGWAEPVHADDLSSVQRKYVQAVEERRGFRIECRAKSGSGAVRWVLHTGIPRFTGGVFMGHIGTTIDITNLKRSQERMIAAEKLQSLGYLTAGIAHDFNNLVGSILAACDMALTDLPPDSPARASIERIDAAAGRASEIVDLLMTYAGWHGGRIDRIDLSQVVAEMVVLLKHTAPPKAVVTLDLNDGLPEIHANVTQVRQVILNLVMNAFESLGPEGAVKVATDHVCFKRRQSALDLPDGQYCRLVISDTGCGMTPDVQARAFDPFYSTKFIGRGLGLAVVHGIIRSLGGAIHIKSAPGKGSTVEVFLPCVARSAGECQQLRPAAAGA